MDWESFWKSDLLAMLETSAFGGCEEARRGGDLGLNEGCHSMENSKQERRDDGGGKQWEMATDNRLDGKDSHMLDMNLLLWRRLSVEGGRRAAGSSSSGAQVTQAGAIGL